MIRFCLVALALLANAASAAERLQFAPPEAWVKPAILAKPKPVSDGAAVRLILADYQDSFGPDGDALYVETASQVVARQGLQAVGNVAFSWDPQTETVTIHKLHILRGERTIDVLASGQTFTIARREEDLEWASLDGVLTAVLQPEGLQVGDILDVALTVKRNDPVLRGKTQQLMVSPPSAPVDRLRVRAIWPKTRAIRWRQTRGLPSGAVTSADGNSEFLLDLNDVQPAKLPAGAPLRYAMVNQFEFSEFASWGEVAGLMAPLYEQAAQLSQTSPLRREIDTIKAGAADPAARASAALRLVQSQVRYVYIGLDSGGYIPAAADLTWSRRFGDCKGKTVLLLALLRGLGIKAEPAFVNTSMGDGLNERLPMPGVFDHVLARATIDGKVYWLDATRVSDQNVAAAPTPNYHWALPVRSSGAALEPLVVASPHDPQGVSLIRLDASAGLEAPALAHMEMIYRGDSAQQLVERYRALSKTDTDRVMREFWRGQYPWITIESALLLHDQATGDVRMTMDGRGTMEWTKLASGVRFYETDLGALGWDADFQREPDLGPLADAPFAVDFPDYTDMSETIVLPRAGEGFRLQGGDVDQVVGAWALKRTTTLVDGVVTFKTSRKALSPEFPAAQAASAAKTLRALAKEAVIVITPTNYVRTEAEMDLIVASTPTTAEEFMDRANVFDAREDMDHVVADLDSALALDPGLTRALAFRGLTKARKGDLAGAKVDLDRAQALDPNQVVVHRGRGVLLAAERNYPAALAAYDQALKLRPQDTYSLRGQARVFDETRQFDKALAALAQAQAANPNLPETYQEQAWIFYETRALDKALESIEHYERLRPRNAAGVALKGAILNTLGRKSEALAAFDAALALRPNMMAYVGRAQARPVAQLSLALADLDLAAKVEPKAPDLGPLRASLYSAAGDHGQAIGVWDGLIASHPERWDYLNGGCWEKAIAGQALQSALANCEAGLKLEPANGALLDSRAFVRLRLNQFDDAIGDYDAALKIRPNQAASLYGRGIARLRKGETAAGQDDLKAARAVEAAIDGKFAAYGIQP